MAASSTPTFGNYVSKLNYIVRSVCNSTATSLSSIRITVLIYLLSLKEILHFYKTLNIFKTEFSSQGRKFTCSWL